MPKLPADANTVGLLYTAILGGTNAQSIYNICILNYCKLTFEFFKNYIFEKHRQFLNCIIEPDAFILNITDFVVTRFFTPRFRCHVRVRATNQKGKVLSRL